MTARLEGRTVQRRCTPGRLAGPGCCSSCMPAIQRAGSSAGWYRPPGENSPMRPAHCGGCAREPGDVRPRPPRTRSSSPCSPGRCRKAAWGVVQGVPQLVAPPGQVTLSLDTAPATASTRTMRATMITGTLSAAQLSCLRRGFGAPDCGIALSRACSAPSPSCPSVAIMSPAVVVSFTMAWHQTSLSSPVPHRPARPRTPAGSQLCEPSQTGGAFCPHGHGHATVSLRPTRPEG